MLQWGDGILEGRKGEERSKNKCVWGMPASGEGSGNVPAQPLGVRSAENGQVSAPVVSAETCLGGCRDDWGRNTKA